MNEIFENDPLIYKLISGEMIRQQRGLDLIPSENYVSKAVLQAMGSVFTNKYSEGYPGKRYYGGQEFVDKIEKVAIERAKNLFKVEHVNVQPYSGSPANQAVFFALMKIFDKFMGLDLGCGGHLTHGSKVNFSGIHYKAVPYFVDRDTGLIDFDEVRKTALKKKPKMIISSLTSYPRKLDFKSFQEICEEVGAYHFADISHIAGLIVGDVHESPFPYSDVVTTTTHKSLRGPRGALIMSKKQDRLHDEYHKNTDKNLAELLDSAVFPGIQGGPHVHIIAAKAVALLEAAQPDFKDYAVQVVKNAKALAEELMLHGMKLVTDGTDNHLMVIDLRHIGLKGKGARLQRAMDRTGMTVNKNAVPFDDSSPFSPSGLRIGTPAVTTRGMKENEMGLLANLLVKSIKNYKDKDELNRIREKVIALSLEFPLYPGYKMLK
jgi:glycine hydroxymethyltransferase